MDSKLLWESRYLLVKLEKLLEVVERDLTEFRAVHISKGQRQYSFGLQCNPNGKKTYTSSVLYRASENNGPGTR